MRLGNIRIRQRKMLPTGDQMDDSEQSSLVTFSLQSPAGSAFLESKDLQAVAKLIWESLGQFWIKGT